ncbi:MAG TPA: hypothetical protein VIU61_08140, partial [Kofleriaceae bacterium]
MSGWSVLAFLAALVLGGCVDAEEEDAIDEEQTSTTEQAIAWGIGGYQSSVHGNVIPLSSYSTHTCFLVGVRGDFDAPDLWPDRRIAVKRNSSTGKWELQFTVGPAFDLAAHVACIPYTQNYSTITAFGGFQRGEGDGWTHGTDVFPNRKCFLSVIWAH